MKESTEVTQHVSVNRRVITGLMSQDPTKVLLRVLSLEVWDHICTQITLNMQGKFREVKSRYATRFYTKPVTVPELLAILGRRLEVTM